MLSAESLALARAWTAMHKSPTGTATECAMEDGHGVTARCNVGCRPALHVCSEEGQ